MSIKNVSVAVVLFATFFVAYALISTPTSSVADLEEGYTLGPFVVYGYGSLSQAQNEAYANMQDFIDDLESQLGPGESIQGVEVLNGEYFNFANEYELEFQVFIATNGPPGA